MILCFKNQGWSFIFFSSKVFESDYELDLKGEINFLIENIF